MIIAALWTAEMLSLFAFFGCTIVATKEETTPNIVGWFVVAMVNVSLITTLAML